MLTFRHYLLRYAALKTPLQHAIWHAWDTFAGVTRASESASWLTKAGYAASSIQADEASDNNERLYLMARKTAWRVPKVNTQSRGWRSLYNLSLEGKVDLSSSRVKEYLQKTLDDIQAVKKSFLTMKPMVQGAEFLGQEVEEAIEASDIAIKAFQAAIRLA